MRQLVLAYVEARDDAAVNKLLLIPCVILDFVGDRPRGSACFRAFRPPWLENAEVAKGNLAQSRGGAENLSQQTRRRAAKYGINSA